MANVLAYVSNVVLWFIDVLDDVSMRLLILVMYFSNSKQNKKLRIVLSRLLL
jgi:hypothetical protein